jgi:hypothetical protein
MDGKFVVDETPVAGGATRRYTFSALAGAAKFVRKVWPYRADDSNDGFRTDFMRYRFHGFSLADLGEFSCPADPTSGRPTEPAFAFRLDLTAQADRLCQLDRCERPAEVSDNEGNRYCRACLVAHRPDHHFYASQEDVARAVQSGALTAIVQND